jgi:hypothetical protein
MKTTKRSMRFFPLFTLLIVLVLSGCKTSNDVVSSRLMQKRKHRPGFHLNWQKHVKHEQEAITGSKHQWTSPDTISQPTDTTKRSDGRTHAIKRLLADHSNGPTKRLMPLSRLPQPKRFARPSLLKDADERSEELEELKEHKSRNKRNLGIAAIVASISLIALVASATAIFLSLSFIPLAFVIATIALPIFSYSVPLFIIYLIEFFSLKRDERYFNALRVQSFERMIRTMKSISIITLIATALSVILLFIGLLVSPQIATVALIALLISLLLFRFSRWIGVILSTAVFHYSEQSRRSLALFIVFSLLMFIVLLTLTSGFLIIFASQFSS